MAYRSCLNINFDSLGWALGLSGPAFRDPTFFGIADRFFALSEKYRFKYTIFIIGKDLENPEVASRVRDWHQQGHEIANHSYTHHANLGSLPLEAIRTEVRKSHDLIGKTCSSEPVGFLAPAWSTSRNLDGVLIENNYLYDTSLFPSYFMWLAVAKLWWNFRNDSRQKIMIQRQDWWDNVFGNTRPFRVKTRGDRSPNSRLVMVPLPVVPFMRVPCWHTLSFVVPQGIFDWLLAQSLKQRDFYYVMHPADLLDTQDVDSVQPGGNSCFERMELCRAEKLSKIERSLALIHQKSERLVPLRVMVEEMLLESPLLAGMS